MVLQGLAVLQVRMVLQELAVQMVLQELVVLAEQTVHQGHQELVVAQELAEQTVRQEHQENEVLAVVQTTSSIQVLLR